MKPCTSKGFATIYKQVMMCWNAKVFSTEEPMARLSPDVVVFSKPVRTFPNGDFFYIELSRKHNRYNCVLKMARDASLAGSVVVVRAQGKTIREAEDDCYRKALERCPKFPRPPYVKRGSQSARVVTEFHPDCFKEPAKS